MIPRIPKEIYELFVDAGITNAFVGFPVEGYGFILPEITVIAYQARPGETYYDIKHSNICIQTPNGESGASNGPLPHKRKSPLNNPTISGLIILNNLSGASWAGHAAVIAVIQNKGLTYVSKDQFTGSPFGSPPKYIIKDFSSYAKFKASAHNYALQDEFSSHTTEYGEEIDSLEYRVKIDKLGNKIERYNWATFIPLDSAACENALRAAEKSVQTTYILTSQDCSHVVTDALKAANLKTGEYSPILFLHLIIPFPWYLLNKSPTVKYGTIELYNKNIDIK